MTSLPLPAILGGDPIRPEGPPGWPLPDPEVQLALEAVYSSGDWGRYEGERVEQLLEELRALHNVSHVLTCGSGTFAVELALRALKVGRGDHVILSAYDYPGNFLTVHALGAMPILIDVHPQNWNLDPDHLRGAITPQTKAILVSHLHGGLVPMREVMRIASDHGVPVLEDAAQCPGASLEGRMVGTWGDVGTLSFGGSKLLTAGRGGAILTNDKAIAQRARLAQMRGNVVNPLSELQAAVLMPQLKKLFDRNDQRLNAARLLAHQISDVPGIKLFENSTANVRPAYYKVGFQFDEESFGVKRERFTQAISAEGIAWDEGFRSLHVQRSESRFIRGCSLTEADRAHQGCVILHHPILLGAEAELKQISDAVHRIWHHRAHI